MKSQLIDERCLHLGLCRTDLARLTGLSWDVIAHLEEHGEPPALTLDAARRLASALNIDLTTLASRNHSPRPPTTSAWKHFWPTPTIPSAPPTSRGPRTGRCRG